MRTPVDQLAVWRPRTLRDALLMLRNEAPLVPLAGGTDLMVMLNAGTLGSGSLGRGFLDLWSLRDLRFVRTQRSKRPTLHLGALTTFTDCIRSQAINRLLPILSAAAREIGGVQIQNRGTLAGNIGNASPAADSLPVLAAADTTIVLRSVDGEREIPLGEYFTGYRQTVRRPDELIVEIRIEVPKGRQVFRKVGTRAAQAISKVAMAAIGQRIAFGSVAPTVVRARHVEAYLSDGGRDTAMAQRQLASDLHPIDDVRSTAAYRRRVAANLLASLLS